MIGERVRHAREFCGLTQIALAGLSGLAQSKISEIEAGRESQPKPGDVVAIAQATGFPASFFHLGPLPDLPDGNFRRLKRGKAHVTRQVRAQARQIVEVIQRAEDVVPMPPIRLRPARTAGDLDELAAEFRDQAGVGEGDPIPNLTRAAERAGVIVVSLPGEMPDHSGYSVWPDFGLEGRPLIVFDASEPGDRQRFTVGHELGHLILHSPVRDEEVEAKDAEAEASRFAGALLLPLSAAQRALRPPLTLTTLAHVKATYGASIATCAQRALDLGLISDARFVALRKQLTSRGWNHHEPVEVPNEHPLLIRKVLDCVGTGYSVADRAESVKMPSFAFRSLAAVN